MDMTDRENAFKKRLEWQATWDSQNCLKMEILLLRFSCLTHWRKPLRRRPTRGRSGSSFGGRSTPWCRRFSASWGRKYGGHVFEDPTGVVTGAWGWRSTCIYKLGPERIQLALNHLKIFMHIECHNICFIEHYNFVWTLRNSISQSSAVLFY